MRVPYILGVTAASLVMLTAAANAQNMDRRDLLDPFGVWNGSPSGHQEQIFSAGPPSKSQSGSQYSNQQFFNENYGYDEQMPGQRWR